MPVRLVPWSEGDLPLLQRLLGDPAMTEHIGGPETAEQIRRHAHAFPSVSNPPSNAICRKAGFTLLGPCEFEYPPGHVMKVNDWQFDLNGPIS